MRGSPYGQPSDGGGARRVRSYEQSRPQTLPLCLTGHGLFQDAGCTNFAPASSPIAGVCLDGTTAKDSHVPSVAANDIDRDGFLESIEAVPVNGPEILQLADP